MEIVERLRAGKDLARCDHEDAADVIEGLFGALKDMAEWWAYAMDKPPGAEPSADDHKKVEQMAVNAIHALHAADSDYVHRLPGAAQ
jgi:hypothetical protein